MRRRIVIIGGGLSGLSVAWHLAQRGKEAAVFEKESEVGGLCRSKQKDGFTFDYCGHLLHCKRAYTLRLVKGLLGDNLRQIKRSAWVYYAGAYIPYPFQAHLDSLPAPVARECIAGLGNRSRRKKHSSSVQQNFRTWIVETFGKGIARHFMLPYNAKFWNVPLAQITCDWIDGLIPAFHSGQARLSRSAKERLCGQYGYNHHFWYPRHGGIRELPLAFASRLKNIFTDSEVVCVNTDKKTIEFANGRKEKFDTLVITLPLPQIKDIFVPLPGSIGKLCNQLRFNSIFNLNLGIGRNDLTGRHWAYYPQPDISFFRVGFFHNFSSSLVPEGKGALYTEVAYRGSLPLPRSRMSRTIRDDLRRLGILHRAEQLFAQDVNVIKFGYPVYDFNYRATTQRLFSYLLKRNIIPCGRYGAWRYASMEDVILEGKEIARKL